MNKTIYFYLTAHGFGHIGMTAPLINYYLRQERSTRVIIQSNTEIALLRQWINGDFTHVKKANDIGILFGNAFQAYPEETHQAYLDRHQRWHEEIDKQISLFEEHQPNIVISNISEIVIAAAHQANIPSIALSSLNWADTYWAYCKKFSSSDKIMNRLVASYRLAHHFLIPTPGMTMPLFNRNIIIGPIARLGSRLSLHSTLGVSTSKKLVLVSMGGIATPIDCANWPWLDDIVWLGNFEKSSSDNNGYRNQRNDLINYSNLNINYIDLLCNCSVLITKPGYGNFTEAACNGIPVLYARRFDWPEEPFLINWLKEHVQCREISMKQLLSGEFTQELHQLWGRDFSSENRFKHRPLPSGVNEATTYIESLW